MSALPTNEQITKPLSNSLVTTDHTRYNNVDCLHYIS